MPKIPYIQKKFNPIHSYIIQQTNEIITEFAADGFGLSLRQLYYQFVQLDLFPESWRDRVTKSKNNDKSYSKLGEIISDARMAGLVDWDAITDRGRWLRGNAHTEEPEDVVTADMAEGYMIDAWANQNYRPEIWVEKDALIGVLDSVCPDLDVNYFSCRGYTSQSEMWKAAMRMRYYRKTFGQEPVIIHLGDHDPSGVDMSRDILDRLELFTGWKDEIEFSRIALNMDQINQYAPPPNPAKITDSRSAKYIRAYGDESWELDALSPRVLADLITAAVLAYRDEDIYDEAMRKQDEHRDLIRRAAAEWPAQIAKMRES